MGNRKRILSIKQTDRIEQLCSQIINHVDKARQNVMRSVDTEMVKAYWLIGRDIVQEEQFGQAKAKYGEQIIETVSKHLNKKYGNGFSVPNIRNMRQFYLEYCFDGGKKQHYPIRYTVCSEFGVPNFHENLGWSHYRALMRIPRLEARAFYESEAINNNWSARELQRQIASLLFDRLAKSKDKKGLLKLARNGQEFQKAEDAIKEPMVLEFLGLPESHRLIESKLEEALINNLQQFLLELGKGFAFVARQKRLTLNGDHFYADLVFYHVILKCYIILDIKTKALTHNDLGQMQLYVNYFDKEITINGDNPTIGLVLCTKKNDAMVRYTLGDKAKQIFASTYQFHLPTEKELEAELKRELKFLNKNKFERNTEI